MNTSALSLEQTDIFSASLAKLKAIILTVDSALASNHVIEPSNICWMFNYAFDEIKTIEGIYEALEAGRKAMCQGRAA